MLPSPTFLLAAAVLALTPGPGMAYVVARTVSGGRRQGIASCAGTAAGGLVHVVAAALGLSLAIAESAAAFSIVKLLGATYLVYLGIRLLRRSDRAPAAGPRASHGPSDAFREGVVVEIFNVKTALFFLAFIPQFVAPGEALMAQFVLLGCICVVLNTAVDVMAVLATRRFVQAGPLRVVRERLLRRVSGATMIGLGAFVALARRDH